MKLDRDAQGDVILKQVTGWTTGPVADIAVLLGVHYVSTPEELEKGASKTIQFVLTPQQALDLAEILRKSADKILNPPTDPKAM